MSHQDCSIFGKHYLITMATFGDIIPCCALGALQKMLPNFTLSFVTHVDESVSKGIVIN